MSSIVKFLFIAMIMVYGRSSLADKLDTAISTGTAINQAAVNSQKKIDKLSDQTQQMLNEYRQTVRETEVLTAYNKHLRQLLQSQNEEKTSLQRQLQDIEVTQREVVPLMLRMLDSLEAFVKLDFPFLADERNTRITRLRELMVRADVTDSEKYRRIVEAFQIETEYGRTIEAYRADLTVNGQSRTLDFLRIGRIALFYQTLDGSELGVWNRLKKSWELLSGEYRKPIRNGLRIARKEAAPDLLLLPIATPEAVK